MSLSSAPRPLSLYATPARWVVLLGVLVAALWLSAALGGPPAVAAARWPSDDILFAVAHWTVGPEAVAAANGRGSQVVTREYRRLDGGLTATLVLTASPDAKRVYRAGAEVPFLGSGYTIERPPPGVVRPGRGRQSLVARRGEQRWLALSAYGERRGWVGNGVRGWGLVALDAVRGHPNDYFRATLATPLPSADSPAAREAAGEAVTLAETLFSRLAAWYGAPGA